jgi:hypothetical protein
MFSRFNRGLTRRNKDTYKFRCVCTSTKESPQLSSFFHSHDATAVVSLVSLTLVDEYRHGTNLPPLLLSRFLPPPRHRIDVCVSSITGIPSKVERSVLTVVRGCPVFTTIAKADEKIQPRASAPFQTSLAGCRSPVPSTKRTNQRSTHQRDVGYARSRRATRRCSSPARRQ